MLRWTIFGLTAAALMAASAASAMDASAVAGTPGGPTLTLLCSGSDSVVALANSRYTTGYGLGTGYALQRVPAELGIVVDKGEVRVRPAPSARPVFTKKSPDGWYRLEKTEVTELLIRGRSANGRLLSDKLDVDRRTGAVTFADFTGVCRPVASTPTGTIF